MGRRMGEGAEKFEGKALARGEGNTSKEGKRLI